MDTRQDTRQTTRAQRGIALYHERGHEIEWVAPSTYIVPSCSGNDRYTVNLRPFVMCTCPDHKRAKALGTRCKHVTAARVAAAKRRAMKARTATA